MAGPRRGSRLSDQILTGSTSQVAVVDKLPSLEHGNCVLEMSSSTDDGGMHAIGTGLPGLRAPLRRRKWPTAPK